MFHIKRLFKGIFFDGPAQYGMIDDYDKVKQLTTSNVSLVSDIMLSEVLDGPELVENIIDCVGYEEGEGYVGSAGDWALIRMGHSAKIHGFNISTARFRDNSATRVQIEACLESELGDEVWKKVLDTHEIQPMTNNFFAHSRGQLVVYNKLRINVVGGISTLKVYGRIVNQVRTTDLVNVAAIANGGRVVASSDNLVGHPERLLLQGPELNWSPGWIPSTPQGPDYVVIALGKPAYIKKMILDTHHTNATAHAAKIFCCHSTEDVPSEKWFRISSGLVLPNRNNRFDNFSPTLKISHVKFELSPATELNRIRIMGWFIDPTNPSPPTPLADEIVISDESEDEDLTIEPEIFTQAPEITQSPEVEQIFTKSPKVEQIFTESPEVEQIFTESHEIKQAEVKPTEEIQTIEIPKVSPKLHRFSFQTRKAKRVPVSTDFTFQMVLPQIKRNR